MKRIWLSLLCLLLVSVGAGWAQTPSTEAKVYLQNSRLAGFRYYDGRKLWPEMRVGDALALVREADNPYDANAIRVEWHERKLGFVPRADNAALARFMDRGQRLEGRVTGLPKDKRRGRGIEFDIYLERQ
jgi:hypothetical protein